MPNPFAGLTPVLKVLVELTDVLPATGQAVEDLVHPDQEETDDTRLSGGQVRVDTILESTDAIYRPTPPLPREERHLFRYFLDGSRTIFFIGTAMEHERATPVQIAQMGAAALRRDDQGQVHTLKIDRSTLLLLARQPISEAVWSQVVEAGEKAGLTVVDIGEEDQLNGKPLANEDWRNRAGGKANFKMHEMEIALASSLPPRQADEWLVVDGSVRFHGFRTLPQMIGVIKSYGKQQEYQIGRGPRARRLSLYNLLAGLPAEHRTIVFGAEERRIAFWYVRLREQGQVEYPLMGVVKVELPNPDGEPVDSDLIDTLSRALVAERHVTSHGRDRRWHVHLYPIYLAEQVIRNGFISREVLRAAIRWPVMPPVSMS